ncbi:4-sulfomuconolactone hydrolase [Aureliella helgolandensis]|uniref:4-sulfomuconolactone hydrolase n=1 Tax=Aureliella helgolandensis TaxID=2527968 RepID=A0A518GG24_9BACT|nr:4-sulfomuconolactone hydrolase [Aureliella helgolandensis]
MKELQLKNHSHFAHSRRQFVSGAVAAASLIGTTQLNATPQATAPAQQDTGWIDAHVHVWHPDTTRYPISTRFKTTDMQPASFTPEELFANCKPAGVKRIVLIQMSFYEFDHRYMLEAMRAHPGVFSGVALIDYRRPDLVTRMEKLAGQGMRGFRLHSQGDADQWVTDPGMAKLWAAAAEMDLAVCPLINPTDIQHVDALCAVHPDTTVVVDHFARIGVSGTIEPQFLDELCQLARFPNTHLKTSAFYALGKKSPPYKDLIPMIKRVYDSFGPERLMWASDCPYQVQDQHDYASSIALVRDHLNFLSEGDKQWMLCGTADKVFF